MPFVDRYHLAQLRLNDASSRHHASIGCGQMISVLVQTEPAACPFVYLSALFGTHVAQPFLGLGYCGRLVFYITVSLPIASTGSSSRSTLFSYTLLRPAHSFLVQVLSSSLTMEENHHDPPQEFELTSRLNALKDSNGKLSTQANPFATPVGSRPNTVSNSMFSSSTALHRTAAPPTYFKSRRIKKGEQERPWLSQKDPKEKWVWIIPLIGLFLGLGLCGVQVWFGLQRISKHTYCPVLDEDWSGGFKEDIWTREAEVGGFG